MKKILLLIIIILCTSVNASMIYVYNIDFITNNDNYNYGSYILEQNQILIVPPEDGIISNDIINTLDYTIRLFESSDNSNINDIELNETTGSFTYIPSSNVVGEVRFEYYIEYNGKKTNTSYIYFYVKNTKTNYTINFYDINNKKIIPSITKNSTVNKVVTESPIILDGYKSINKTITKKMKLDSNIFDFFYEKIPNTGI